jgi:hypothetical protein
VLGVVVLGVVDVELAAKAMPAPPTARPNATPPARAARGKRRDLQLLIPVDGAGGPWIGSKGMFSSGTI